MFFNLLESGIITKPLIISAVSVTVVVFLLAFVCDSKKNSFNSKCIATAGICVALSFGLSFVRLFQMPLGGSITLASILPLLIFSYIYGTKKGVFVGIILGVLNMIVDLQYAIHPAQIILDYIIAYGAMGLVDMFGKIKFFANRPLLNFLSGSITSCILRFISHVLAGSFAWQTPILANMAYNSFVFIDLAIALVVGVGVFSSKQMLKILNNNN